MKLVLLVGRILFSIIFLLAGVSHITGEGVQGAAAKGLPLAAVLVPLSGVVAVLGSLSIILGYKAKIGAWLLVIFLIPVTLVMHNFWAAADAMTRQMQMMNFMKNITMLGGAMMITFLGAGPWSIDAMLKAKKIEEGRPI